MRRIAFLLVVTACGKDDIHSSTNLQPVKPPDPVKPEIKAEPKPDPKPDPKPTVTGPAVTPTVTSAITFFVPKHATTWAELSFPCYRSALELQAGSKASDPFYKVSPYVEVALKAADIDIDRGDFAAIGGWDCGGGACIYLAVNMRHPEKVGAMMKAIPGLAVKELGKDHYAFEAPGAKGPRSIHVRSVPIRWPDKLPTDKWSADEAKATHLLFVTGAFGKGSDVDPLAAVADAGEAADRVKDAESIVEDARGRCAVGLVGKNDFKPGFKLDHARFAIALPEGKSDPVTAMVNSNRTLDVEVELTLAPAATETDVKRWIAETRAWMTTTLAPVKAQFTGQGPVVEAIADMMSVVAERGFRHKLTGPALLLSWQTRRVPQADISAIETRLGALMSKTP